MILQHELDRPSAGQSTAKHHIDVVRRSRLQKILIFLSFLIAIVCLQVVSGAYHSEFGGYPDEAAHYVTSLMVHDYIASHKFVSPGDFAQNFYDHYPKVAFGHWPPLFYLIQACWMLLFSASRTSVLMELAVTTALLAYSVFLIAERWFNRTAGFMAGLLLICVPLIQRYTDEEMAETLLALTCLWSAVYFARYIESERWQDSALFGVFVSLAVMTKGSGWLLGLVPPIVLFLMRKWRLLLKPQFWIGPAVAFALCLPWQIFTLSMAERGWVGSSLTVSYLASALPEFLLILTTVAGYAMALLAVIGIVSAVFVPAFRGRATATPAAMFALIVSDWIFHSIVPAGVEDRKMIMAVPALVLFVLAGVYWLAARLPARISVAWRRLGIAAVAVICFGVQTFAIPREIHYGYIEAARFITSNPQLRNATVLVSSESPGEGLLISEIAMHEARPGHVVIRATKALARVDWSASKYQSLFSTPQQIIEYLKQQHVGVVVMDTFRAQNAFLHDQLLRRAIQESGDFRLVATFGSSGEPHEDGRIQIFRFEPKTET